MTDKKKVQIDSINGPNGIFKKILITSISAILVMVIVNVYTAYNTSKQVPINTENIHVLEKTKADKKDVEKLEHNMNITLQEIKIEGKDINKKLDQFILLHINSER